MREELTNKLAEFASNTDNLEEIFENHLKDFPETKHTEECSFLTLKSYYLLAKNSIETKKYERFKITIDSYVKFAEKFPNSIYQREAEKIYSNALQQLEKYI